MAQGSRIRNVLEEPINNDCYDSYDEPGSGQVPSSCESKSLLPKSRGRQLFYLPARFVLLFWSCLGFVCMYALRMDLNLVILDMVTSGNDSNELGTVNVSHQTHRFHWSEHQQYILLSAFYYGYSSTQILGGYLAGRFGGKVVFGLASVVSALLGMVTPFSALQSYGLVIACRLGQGLAQGLAQPCMHTIWSNWAPENERSSLLTITYAGCQLGNIIATLGSGYMCAFEIMGGWPSIFYAYGAAGIVWAVFWFLLVHDSPSEHPRISEHERRYIEKCTKRDLNKMCTRTDWTKVLTSPALLAIIAAQFANDWGSIALTTCLPQYLKTILQYDLTQNGFLCSVPFMVILVANPVSGIIADFLRSRHILSTKNTRKLMNSIGLFIPCGLMLAVVFWGRCRVVIVTLFTLAVGISGFTMAGYSVNHLDIAPSIAGILYGITNTLGTTVGFIGPVILGVLTSNHNTEHQWHIFFYITSGIFFVGGLLFFLFAQGQPQNWSVPETSCVVEKDVVVAEEDQTEQISASSVHGVQNKD